MIQAKNGDTVKVHYTGKLDDGTVFDSSLDDDPLEFTIGGGDLIPGFEAAVVGMMPGDSKTELIPADRAYGPRMDEMVMEVGREHMRDDFEPEIGQSIQVRQPDGEAFPAIITDICESSVTLDANHPLAGMDLTFEIQLVEIA